MGIITKGHFRLFLVRLATFLFLFFALDFILGYLVRKLYFSQKIKNTYSIQQTRDELLIVGSSRAQHHYIPSIIFDSLGLSCFNLGSGGQNIYYHYAIIESTLERYSPKLIILDLMYIDYTVTDAAHDKENLSVLLPYYSTKYGVREIINLRGPLEKIKLLSSIYPYNSKLTDIIYAFFKGKNNPQFSRNGYIPLNGEFDNVITPDTVLGNEIDTQKLNYLKKIVELCNKCNVQLIIIFSPIFIQERNSISFSQEINKLAHENNIELWNYEQDSSFVSKKALFRDVLHLNYTGAELFTKKVAGRIKNNRKGEVTMVPQYLIK